MWFNKKKDAVQITSLRSKDEKYTPGTSTAAAAIDEPDGGIFKIFSKLYCSFFNNQ